MTAALLLVGSCQMATGAGLTAVRMPARILLILTGLSTLGIAATPEPATGPTPRHLAFAVSCVVTTVVWPVLVAGRHAGAIVDPQCPRLRDDDRDLRRVVLLAPDRSSRRRR